MVRCAVALCLVACAGEQAFELGSPLPKDTPTEPEEIARLTQLCINEFMADNNSSWLDDQGVASDWVELHNPTSESVSLFGFFLSNDEDDPFTHRLDDDLRIEAGEYLVNVYSRGAGRGSARRRLQDVTGGVHLDLARPAPPPQKKKQKTRACRSTRALLLGTG